MRLILDALVSFALIHYAAAPNLAALPTHAETRHQSDLEAD